MDWEDSIVFLGVDNLDGVDEFYRKGLNLSLYKDQGVCKIYEVPGNGMIGFCTHMDKNVADKSPIITLLSDDVDGIYRKIKKTKYEIKHPPKINSDFNIYHFFLKDPEGYTVEIQKFLK